jgi:hypothetical protein
MVSESGLRAPPPQGTVTCFCPEKMAHCEAVDLEKLRVALRQMGQGHLLMVAERAIEIVSNAEPGALVGDVVRLPLRVDGDAAAPLLDEVRKFHDASMRGDYYDSFQVNSKNCMGKSKGTDAFTAGFERLTGMCVCSAAKGSHASVREAFDLLFALLRRLDEHPDTVAFFAGEAGSWQMGVDGRAVLSAYFRCLADCTSGEDFTHEAARVISDWT